MIQKIQSKFKKGSFYRNFSVLTGGEAVTHAINMFINVLIARRLAPESYGVYTLFISYVTIFFTISSLGLRRIVIRCIARQQDNSKHYFVISLILRFYGFALAVLAFLVYNYFNQVFSDNLIIYCLLAGVFLNSFWEGFQNVAFGMERMETTSIINIGMSLLLLIIYLSIDKSFYSPILVMSVYIFDYFLRDLIYLISLFKQKLITGTCTLKGYYMIYQNIMIKDSIPYYILSLFSIGSTQIPILFLNNNSSIEQVSFFNLANKLLLPMTLLVNSALVALFPNQSKEFAKNKKRFVEKSQKILVFICLVGVISSFYISLFRKEIVFLLYGNVFAPVSDILALQCWYVVLFSVFGFIGSTLGAANKQNWVGGLSIIYALINVPILWVASQYQALGLAYGYLIGGVINLTYHFYYFQKALPYRLPSTFIMKLLLIFVVSCFFVMLIPKDMCFSFKIVIAILGFLFLFRCRSYLLKLFKDDANK